jgi:succinate dehydrogenase / fumarate reductase flavoprotein subunit
VPFAREYGGLLDTRSFGGAQLQRTFYCRGQTGQQLLLGAYQALSRQIAAGTVKMLPRCEMLDLVVIDGRVWVPKNMADVGKHPNAIPEEARDYYLERKYPSFGNLAPRDIASRAAKEACDDGRGVGPGGRGVYLDFADAIRRQGKDRIADKYGNLFEMYERITDENGYERPMRIYPAIHYTMGGLWVNYELMSNHDGLFVVGEANFSDHGANRLGSSALM